MKRQNPYITDEVVYTPGEADWNEEQWELQFRNAEDMYNMLKDDDFFNDEEE